MRANNFRNVLPHMYHLNLFDACKKLAILEYFENQKKNMSLVQIVSGVTSYI